MWTGKQEEYSGIYTICVSVVHEIGPLEEFKSLCGLDFGMLSSFCGFNARIKILKRFSAFISSCFLAVRFSSERLWKPKCFTTEERIWITVRVNSLLHLLVFTTNQEVATASNSFRFPGKHVSQRTGKNDSFRIIQIQRNKVEEEVRNGHGTTTSRSTATSSSAKLENGIIIINHEPKTNPSFKNVCATVT